MEAKIKQKRDELDKDYRRGYTANKRLYEDALKMKEKTKDYQQSHRVVHEQRYARCKLAFEKAKKKMEIIPSEIKFIRFPMPKGQPYPNEEKFIQALEHVENQIRAGSKVVIYDRNGHGRTFMLEPSVSLSLSFSVFSIVHLFFHFRYRTVRCNTTWKIVRTKLRSKPEPSSTISRSTATSSKSI